MPRLAKRLLLIGWDAADWEVIDPLIEAGQMPALAGLIGRGVRGNLATLDPPFSPMLWTSIATGKTADKHGVLGFSQPNEAGDGVRPVLGSTRRVKALWNMAHQSGLRSAVVGWWPSHPAEPVDGVMVSNFFHRVGGPAWAPEPSTPGAVHPESLAPLLDALRVHPDEVTPALVAPFVPTLDPADVSETDQKGADAIARMLAEAASVHAAATWAVEHAEWDLAAVYLDSVDHFSHGFMKYHPPRQEFIDEGLFERFNGVVTAAYRFHDMMLERLLALAGDDTTVVLVSDHGFESGARRLRELPDEPAAPAEEHRSFGVFVAAGPGVARGRQVFGASLLDVTPTALTLLGLPVGDDMDGRVLAPIFAEPPAVERIPSWEDVPGDAGRHPDGHSDPWTDRAALDQLVALGYVEAPGEDGRAAAERSRRESAFYLARVFLWKGMPGRAVDLLEPLWAETRTERYGTALLRAYEGARRLDDGFALADALESDVRQAEARGEAPAAGRALAGLALARGRLHLLGGEPDRAVEQFERADAADDPGLLTALGAARLQAGQAEAAARAARRAVELDPGRAGSLMLLAQALLMLDRPEEARDRMLDALDLRFFNPAGHYTLAQALLSLGDAERGAQALEVALAQRPSLGSARFLLAEVYRDDLGRPVDAARVLAGHDADADAQSVQQRPEDRDVNR